MLVTNPRTGASIVAAALEAGPGAMGRASRPAPQRGAGAGPRLAGRRSAAPPTGTPGSSAGSRPPRSPHSATRPGRPAPVTSARPGDDLTYRWAPDQNATPGPGRRDPRQPHGRRPDGCRPTRDTRPTAARCGPPGWRSPCPPARPSTRPPPGRRITAPTEAVARGLAAGLGTVGLPYVWGGGTDGGGPDNGCARGGGQKNSCGSTVGLDCSGLTGWTLANAGFRIPTNSTSQRAGGTDIPRQNGLPGDIIGYPGHVAVYLGRIGGVDYLLEAPDVGLQVRVQTGELVRR